MLEIIYEDEHLIAINKPHGLLVHQSSIARDATEFALQMLRDQVGKHVSPVHRLDRKTSGILLFALNKEAEVAMHQQFMNGQTEKKNTSPFYGVLRRMLWISIILWQKRMGLYRMHLPLLKRWKEQR